MGYVEKLLPIGSAVKAKVVKYEKEPKIKILLSTEKKMFEKYSNEEDNEEDQKEQSHLDLLIKSVEEINASAALAEENTTEIKLTKNFALPQEPKSKKQDDDEDEDNMEEEEEEEDQENGADDDDQSDMDEDEVQKLIANQGVEFEGFDEEGDDNEDDDDESILSEQSLLDEEFGDEDAISNKKKSKRQKEILKRRKEVEIREQEKKLIDETAQPE